MEFTDRKKVLAFDNRHHDGTLNFGSGDNKSNASHDFILGTYNNIEANQKHVSSDPAAIIVEPMLSTGGQILATREFPSFLRKTADVTGAVLIFDEIMRSCLPINGLQGLHKVKPDTTALGKYIRTQKLSHYEAFNNDVFTMSAALAATDLTREDEIRRVNKLGDTIRNKMSEICATHHYSDLEINWSRKRYTTTVSSSQ
ncbi:glutamate-1-semialdehyde 2 1-aminomutase [Fusarium pseudoanthophilum]|uniref:Glutamate-1-semialdehyde 2 1-aminomutase n=1 Tax=Fusarium pseudoanthophilum TaxID=48495 RepID=A0A8H5UUW2_9HYPO|nr:glutamate-1-semialdehyde 2 1-aminomutase [Fusarium pseudoanthophilum]